MPVPKFRTSRSKRNSRRAHDALTAPGQSVCPNCNEVKHPHSVCESCGHYRGRQVVEPRTNLGFDESFDTEA